MGRRDGLRRAIALSFAVAALALLAGGSAVPAGAATPTASYSQDVLAASPVSYWRLGETSGTSAADETGRNPGTYTNVLLEPTGRAYLRHQPLSLLLRRAELRASAGVAFARHDLGGDGRVLGQAADDLEHLPGAGRQAGERAVEVRELRRLARALGQVHRLLRERRHLGGRGDAARHRHELAPHRRDPQRLERQDLHGRSPQAARSRRRCS